MGQILHRLADVRAPTLGPVIEELPEDPQDVATALAGRHELLDPVGEDDEPDLVVVLDGAEGEEGADLHGQLPLHPLAGAEVSRGAHVNHQHHRQLPLLLEDLHEGGAAPGRDVPVDVADVVAVLVLADLGEAHAAPLEHRVVLAGEDLVDQAPRPDLDPTNLLQDLPGDHPVPPPRSRRRTAQGTST